MGDHQIVKTYTTDNPAQIPGIAPKMMKVDQLWLCLLDNNTVVTAFSEVQTSKDL